MFKGLTMRIISSKTVVIAILTIYCFVGYACKDTRTGPSIPQRDVQWKIYTETNSKLVDNVINVIYIDGADVKWFGTNDGACRFGYGNWETYKKELEFDGIGGKSRKVNAITVGLDDRVWIGLAGGGIRRIVRGSPELMATIKSPVLKSDMVYTLFRDRGGYIWVGTAKGVCRCIPDQLDPDLDRWTQYTSESSPLPDEPIRTIATNPLDNVLWFGTYTQGLISYNNDLDWTINSPLEIPFPVTSISFTFWNFCWVGTYADWAYQFDVNTTEWKQYGTSSDSGLPDFIVNATVFDPAGIAWFGTNKGITKFDGSKWKTWNSSNSQLPSNTVKSLAVDKRGNLWIGTSSGVAEFNEGGILN